ncbi:hypothetical protein RCL_jg24679.t1 [Rhizophagus clarus]|uniref:Uncharacterized protein n=1 Tax=Rhizophagus clarus TaxID=94130 RepID=A0A8H3M402_9GLOM|nr:hypothetical protein RCL_jg24679.t1 [Rhizophagus clarus]
MNDFKSYEILWKLNICVILDIIIVNKNSRNINDFSYFICIYLSPNNKNRVETTQGNFPIHSIKRHVEVKSLELQRVTLLLSI